MPQLMPLYWILSSLMIMLIMSFLISVYYKSSFEEIMNMDNNNNNSVCVKMKMEWWW